MPDSTDSFKLPYRRFGSFGVYCPACGGLLLVTTRQSEKAAHHDAVTMTCQPCKLSWRVPVAIIDTAVPTDYDNGIR